MSTTAVLRWVHGQADADIRRAIDILSWSKAKPAVRVLQAKLRNHPAATTFGFEKDGFITVA